MTVVSTNLADEVIESLDLSEARLLMDLAIGLYTEQQLTLGQAAQISGLSQSELLRELGRRRIPVNYAVSDFRADLETIERLGRR
jgi:predicted HTH domain antitoxin